MNMWTMLASRWVLGDEHVYFFFLQNLSFCKTFLGKTLFSMECVVKVKVKKMCYKS